jgi:hypothetical protein
MDFCDAEPDASTVDFPPSMKPVRQAQACAPQTVAAMPVVAPLPIRYFARQPAASVLSVENHSSLTIRFTESLP